MPEENEKEAPTSIDLGEVEANAAPKAVDLGVDATQGTTFSGTITTDAGVVLVDPSLMPPEKEEMNKKQFLFGLLFPIVLGIIVASVSAIFEEFDEGERFEIAAQEDGTFNFTLGDYGLDCESDYGWFDIEWQTEEGNERYHYANSGCGEELSLDLEDEVGNWYSNGSIFVDLPFAPLENTSVVIEWYDQNSNRERTKVLDPPGDGSNTKFNGNEPVPSHCYDINRGDYYHLNEDGEESRSQIFGDEASNGCLLYTNYDYILARNVNSVDPISFSFPENYSKVDSIKIDIRKDDGDSEQLLALALSSFCCLAAFGVPIGAYMAGHKWFAYGAGVGLVAVPVIFFIGFIAMIAMYTGGI